MREIKFRSWDGDKMYCDGDFASCSCCGSGSGYNTDYELMQYTGLKDARGVEIYEGDIVRSHSNQIIPSVVIWQAPSFVMKEKLKTCYSALWSNFVLSPDQNQFEEVIGNIHQNPELLEG